MYNVSPGLSAQQATVIATMQQKERLHKEKMASMHELISMFQKTQQLELEFKRMISDQCDDTHKIKVLSYSTLGLSVLIVLLVLVIVFKRKKSQNV